MAKASAQREQLSKKAYEARVPGLREKLVQLQVQLKESPFKVVLILAGVAGAGRGDVINMLGGWLDPRGVETFAFHKPTDEERERPLMWRYWRSLPSTGRIGIYAGSWYTETLREETNGKKALAQLDHELRRIRHFEKLLHDNGTLVVKIWLHLSRDAQRRRLRELERNPDTAWRVTPEDWQAHRFYDRLARTAEYILTETDRPGAAWDLVDAEDARARNLAIAELLIRRFAAHHRQQLKLRKRESKIARGAMAGRSAKPPTSLRPAGLRRLLELPLDQKMSEKEYEEKREKWLGRLARLVRTAEQRQRSIVFVFEGWDAAGKGGAIRRLASAIDARDYRVIPVAKPTDEEKAHHYLWRFWRHVPRAGLVTIYDRSWYGRVLVERIEGFCTEEEWRRAYEEINDFEQQLVEHGIIVVKFWMHITKDEQLKRFRERERTVYKQHKINAEDWRNRRQWTAYEVAIGDMLALCDNPFAPWHLIPANNKRYARLQILKTACKRLEEALEG
ncbi:MAG TPA: polyphosphate:AMP phosphotransferase [Opitutaceae bacterium]